MKLVQEAIVLSPYISIKILLIDVGPLELLIPSLDKLMLLHQDIVISF